MNGNLIKLIDFSTGIGSFNEERGMGKRNDTSNSKRFG